MEAKKHSEEQQKKYITGGNGKDKYSKKLQNHYYLAPVGLMSENISKGSKEYMDLYSPITSIDVNIYTEYFKESVIDVQNGLVSTTSS